MGKVPKTLIEKIDIDTSMDAPLKSIRQPVVREQALLTMFSHFIT